MSRCKSRALPATFSLLTAIKLSTQRVHLSLSLASTDDARELVALVPLGRTHLSGQGIGERGGEGGAEAGGRVAYWRLDHAQLALSEGHGVGVVPVWEPTPPPTLAES